MSAEESPAATPAPVTERSFLYRFIMFFVHIAYTVIWPTKVRGREHLPKEGGALLLSNHQSFLDIPLIAKAVAPRHVAFVARATLADAGWLAKVMRSCGAILIERGKGDRAALRAMEAHLAAGDLVAVFPEGTRTRDGSVAEFKKGAFVVARKAGMPVVPVAIRGSYGAWPRRRGFPVPHRLEAHFGPPLAPEGKELLEATRAAVLELLGDTDVPAR